MKTTYYIVQTSPQMFVRMDDMVDPFYEGRGMDEATRFATIGEARRVRQHFSDTSEARRFPRIVKVTTETKTIKE